MLPSVAPKERLVFLLIVVAMVTSIGVWSVMHNVSSVAVNTGGPSPYNSPIYLIASSGCAVGGSFGARGGPCFGGNLSIAYVFNCATAAATLAGCTATVVIPSERSSDYNLTIWYPRFNQSLPDSNCEFQPSLYYPQPLAAWCTAVSPNGFIISEENPSAN